MPSPRWLNAGSEDAELSEGRYLCARDVATSRSLIAGARDCLAPECSREAEAAKEMLRQALELLKEEDDA